MAKYKISLEGIFIGEDLEEIQRNIRNQMRDVTGMQEWDFTDEEKLEQRFNIRAQIKVLADNADDAESKFSNAMSCAYPEIDDYYVDDVEEEDE